MSAVGISLGSSSATPPCNGDGASNEVDLSGSALTCRLKDEVTRPAEMEESVEERADSEETSGNHGDDLFGVFDQMKNVAEVEGDGRPTGIETEDNPQQCSIGSFVCSVEPSESLEMGIDVSSNDVSTTSASGIDGNANLSSNVKDKAGFDSFPAVKSDISVEEASAPPPEQAAAQTPKKRKKKDRPKLTPTSENSVDPTRSQPEIDGLDFGDFALGNAFKNTSSSNEGEHQSSLVEASGVFNGNTHDCPIDKAMPRTLSDDDWVGVQIPDAQPPSAEGVNAVLVAPEEANEEESRSKKEDRPLKEHREPKEDDVGNNLQAFTHIENAPDGGNIVGFEAPLDHQRIEEVANLMKSDDEFDYFKATDQTSGAISDSPPAEATLRKEPVDYTDFGSLSAKPSEDDLERVDGTREQDNQLDQEDLSAAACDLLGKHHQTSSTEPGTTDELAFLALQSDQGLPITQNRPGKSDAPNQFDLPIQSDNVSEAGFNSFEESSGSFRGQSVSSAIDQDGGGDTNQLKTPEPTAQLIEEEDSERDGFGSFEAISHSGVTSPAQKEDFQKNQDNCLSAEIQANTRGFDSSEASDQPNSTSHVDLSTFVSRDDVDGTRPGNLGDFSEATTNVDNDVASESSALGHGDALVLSQPGVSDARVSEKPSEPSVDEAGDDWGSFGDFTGDEVDDATEQSIQKSAAMDVGDIEPPPADDNGSFGDFGSFDEFEEAPNHSPVVEERLNGELSREEATALPRQPNSTSHVDSSTSVSRDDVDGTHPGKSGDFSEATTNMDDDVASESPALGHGDALVLSQPEVSDARVSEKPSEPSVDEAGDEWGSFGALTGDEVDDATEQSIQKSAAMDVGDIEPPPADDNSSFGDFGSFDEFEEAPNHSPVVEERLNGEASREETNAIPRQPPRIEVLNAAVQSMFQDVFPSNTSLVDDHPAVCTDLPFNVQMRVVMVSTPH